MKKLILVVLLGTLTACGSTSSLRNAKNSQAIPNLMQYKHVIIDDFKDGINASKDKPEILAAGKKFADAIAHEIKRKKIFERVDRNNTDSTSNTLLICGEITQYEEGNAVARALIGLGAGSSHFDATVNIENNQNKETLGQIKVDQMSWALGGAIAASHDVKALMSMAASKIANELAESKKSIATDDAAKNMQ